MSPLHKRWGEKSIVAADLQGSDESANEVIESVVARCLETSRAIECFIDSSVTVKDETYYVLEPCDDVVAIVAFDDNDEPNVIDPDSEEMDNIFPFAVAVFDEEDINLIRSAGVLTMMSESEDDDEDGDDGDDDDDDEGIFLLIVCKYARNSYVML